MGKKIRSDFHRLTEKYLAETNISYRKSMGQYFTPRSIVERLLTKLPKRRNVKVLDPACGTGEFLLAAGKYFKGAKMCGWEIDKKLIDIARKVVPSAELKLTDALLERFSGKFDFVIGNPPYYEFSPAESVREKYGFLFNGRVNIFALFVKLGLDLLKKGGYLAYVLPPSMNNGAYFSKLRKFIMKNANIEFMEILDDASLFHQALQTVMLLVLKKTKNKGDYIFRRNGVLIFSEKAEFLKSKFDRSFSLRELGFSVKTGSVVWNENKNILTNNGKKAVPLIWAHNIKDNKLFFPVKFEKKPQYVKMNQYETGPAIVVNRITGAASNVNIKAALIPDGMKFVAENHINVIRYNDEPSLFGSAPRITIKDLYAKITSPEAVSVMKCVTGNTQISKTEWERLFPVKVR
ncbi:MAG: N-6 DNA methylase [Elusimicrobia bacterium]|nr:N-6 DNA methylase [Elusimicrobiota bacterium]